MATSSIAYVVAKRSEYLEKDTRKFSAIDKCIIKSEPSPFAIAERIVHGEPISFKYNNVLENIHDNPTNDPIEPHIVAYAFYDIAFRMGDVRADIRKKWLKKHFKNLGKANIEKQVENRYFPSYFKKCFHVPPQYKRTIIDNSRIKP